MAALTPRADPSIQRLMSMAGNALQPIRSRQTSTAMLGGSSIHVQSGVCRTTQAVIEVTPLASE